jgi:hypothetical protein
MLSLTSLLLLLAGAAQQPPEHVRITCNYGPIERMFGGGPWKVLGCSDGKTLVLTSANSTSTFPFRYIITFEKGRSLVDGRGQPGEGTDVAIATEQLRQLTADEFAALMKATKSLPKKASGSARP